MLRIFIILFISILCGSFTKSSIEGHEELQAQVAAYLEDKQPKKAIRLLSQMIAKDPQDLNLLACRAEVYLYMNQDADAQIDIERILMKDGNHVRALLTNTRIHVKQTAYDTAQEIITKIKILDKTTKQSSDLLGLQGKLYLKKNEYVAAEDALLQAALCEKSSLGTFYDLATVLEHNEKQEEAILIIEKSIERYGLRLNMLLKAGSICNSQGLYDEAISYLDLALTIDSRNPVALASLAEAYLHVGDMDAANRYLGSALGHDEDSGLASKILGDYLLRMDELSRACKAYKEALASGYAEEYEKSEISASIRITCGAD